MMAPQALIRDGATKTLGVDGFLPFYDRIRSAFPDIHFTVDDTMAEGDKLVVRWSCSCGASIVPGIGRQGIRVRQNYFLENVGPAPVDLGRSSVVSTQAPVPRQIPVL